MGRVKYVILLLVFVFSSMLLQYCKKKQEGDGNWKEIIEKFTFSGPFIEKDKFIPNDSIKMNANDSIHFTVTGQTKIIQISGLFNNEGLYATPPLPPAVIEQDSLKIITFIDFDTKHPAGSCINECFVISGHHDYGEFYSIDSFKTFNLKYKSQLFDLTLIKKPVNKALNFKLFFYNRKLNDGMTAVSPFYEFN